VGGSPRKRETLSRRRTSARQEQEVPGGGDSHGQKLLQGRGQNRRGSRGHVSAGNRRSRQLVPGERAVSADKRASREEQLHLRQPGLRERRRLASLGVRT